MDNQVTLEKVISLAKRRGFIFAGSEIYGGLANTYDFGPLGTELKRNLLNHWWNTFVTTRQDMYGLDTSVLMSPRVWEASGHTASFTNIMIDCLECNYRTRADHLVEDALPQLGNVEGKPLEELDEIIAREKITCPKCKKQNWTKVRNFNQLFETQIGIITEGKNTAYLRGELAQGMFVDFKQVLDSIHPRLPFGLAQSGKAFRNEITMGKFTFRTLEFDLAEFEYFVKPEEWEKHFEYWKKEMYQFAISLGLDESKLRWRSHTKEELSHYSSRTEDLEYQFPWGYKEMFGLAYRTDFDLKNHIEKSGVDLRYIDPYTQEKFIPHVIEPTFGLSRLVTIILMNAYTEDLEKQRVVLKLPSTLSPYKVAVFPLVANKENISTKAKEVFDSLKMQFPTMLDERGNIGKRYFTHDEIGTPFCITIDYQTLEDSTVTIRDRDAATQQRISVDDLQGFLFKKSQMKEIKDGSIKTAIFDMDGTIYEFDGVSGKFADSTLRRLVDQNATLFISQRENISLQEANKKVKKLAEQKIPLSHYARDTYQITRSEFLNEVWDLTPELFVTNYEDAVIVIKELAERQIELVLLTQSPQIWQNKVFTFLNLDGLFSEIYTGEFYNKKSEVFSALAQKRPPLTVLAIGDQIDTDITPAKEQGFYTFHVTSPKDLLQLIQDE